MFLPPPPFVISFSFILLLLRIQMGQGRLRLRKVLEFGQEEAVQGEIFGPAGLRHEGVLGQTLGKRQLNEGPQGTGGVGSELDAVIVK